VLTGSCVGAVCCFVVGLFNPVAETITDGHGSTDPNDIGTKIMQLITATMFGACLGGALVGSSPVIILIYLIIKSCDAMLGKTNIE
jgi:hypothetical protein